MSKAEEKKAEKVKEEKAKFKISIRIHGDGTSTVYQGNGFPHIIDKTEKSIQWLANKGFKAEEIEILGDKPEVWESIYPSPKAAEPEPTLVEKVAEVLTPAVETPAAV